MGDAEWELELERRVEQEEEEFEGDLSPLEARVRVLEQWQAGQAALSEMRRWLLPILVTIAVTVLNIGASVFIYKY